LSNECLAVSTIVIAFGVFVIAALLFFILQGRAGTSARMRTAFDLLAVHQAMTKDGLSGFLPGNHSRLGERLRRKRFTSVSILPNMVSGTHSIHVPGVRCSTSPSAVERQRNEYLDGMA
jgi:hypothetical protein